MRTSKAKNRYAYLSVMLQRETTQCIGQGFDCGVAACLSAMHTADGCAFDPATEEDDIAVNVILTPFSLHFFSGRC